MTHRQDIVFSLILPCGVSYSTPQGPRLLPLYVRNILNGISAKNPLKYYVRHYIIADACTN
jgi:hypothetical protein